MEQRPQRPIRPEHVRAARRNHLATALARSRREERAALLAKLWRRRQAGRPAVALSGAGLRLAPPPRTREESGGRSRPVSRSTEEDTEMMTPQLHMDIAHQRHAELVRRAEQARLARQVAAGDDPVVLSVARRFRRLVAGRSAVPKLEPRVARPTA
jgi:hypothetical protein